MIARDLAHLHGDTIELARMGNNLTKRTGLTEKGQIVPGLNDYQVPRDSDWEFTKTTPYTNRHEMLTGSQLDGRAYPPGIDYTCNNWTSNSDPAPGPQVLEGGPGRPNAQIGFPDRNGGGKRLAVRIRTRQPAKVPSISDGLTGHEERHQAGGNAVRGRHSAVLCDRRARHDNGADRYPQEDVLHEPSQFVAKQ